MLLEQGRQLHRLTTVIEAIMEELQAKEAASSTPIAPSRSVPATPAEPSVSTMLGPCLSLPDKFTGKPEHCTGFLMQCQFFLLQQAHLYPADEAKVSFMCSLLSGEALEWLAPVWSGGSLPFHSYEAFTQLLRSVFQHATSGREPILQEMAQDITELIHIRSCF
uniref:DUF4939 domain-containing protein n=1 Tax=Oryzias melastigma TaxID=30732 RepID=A0A3B3BJ76_ORYME